MQYIIIDEYHEITSDTFPKEQRQRYSGKFNEFIRILFAVI